MASRIRRLLERQGEDLARLQDKEAAAFLRAYDDARRELLEDLQRMEAQGLDKTTPYTAQYLRIMLAQTEGGIRKLQERLGHSMDEVARHQGEKAMEHLLDTISAAESDFTDAGGRVEHEVLRRITSQQGLLLHRYSLNRYGTQLVEAIQRELVTGVTRGQTFRELTERIAGLKGSVLEGARFRAELIVRMEMNRAYNDSHLESLRGAHEILDDPDDDDPMMKRADEYTDLRNHAISRVLDGQVVGIEDLFRVSRAKVEAEHERIQAARRKKRLPKRRLSGILWELQGGDYVGLNYPVHFWERGRITSWRRSWEETAVEMFGGKATDEFPRRYQEVERDPTLGNRARLSVLAAMEAPPPAGTPGVLLDDVDPINWMVDGRFDPDAVPHAVRRDLWFYGKSLGNEVGIQLEMGQVRLVSGTTGYVGLEVGSPGVHPVAHTHPHDKQASKRDVQNLRKHVLALGVEPGELPSMIIWGPGEDDFTVYYGQDTHST